MEQVWCERQRNGRRGKSTACAVPGPRDDFRTSWGCHLTLKRTRGLPQTRCSVTCKSGGDEGGASPSGEAAARVCRALRRAPALAEEVPQVRRAEKWASCEPEPHSAPKGTHGWSSVLVRGQLFGSQGQVGTGWDTGGETVLRQRAVLFQQGHLQGGRLDRGLWSQRFRLAAGGVRWAGGCRGAVGGS